MYMYVCIYMHVCKCIFMCIYLCCWCWETLLRFACKGPCSTYLQIYIYMYICMYIYIPYVYVRGRAFLYVTRLWHGAVRDYNRLQQIATDCNTSTWHASFEQMHKSQIVTQTIHLNIPRLIHIYVVRLVDMCDMKLSIQEYQAAYRARASGTCMSASGTCMSASFHRYESHVWVGHVTDMNKSWHTFKWFM